MATIYLVRHGQAGGQDYNKLTAAGEEQARLLGRYLKRAGIHFDSTATGSLGRQQETLQLIRSEMSAEACPEPDTHNELNEIEPRVFAALAADLRGQDDHFRRELERWTDSLYKDSQRATDPDAVQNYRSLLTRMLRHWILERGPDRGRIPSFEQFRATVLSVRTKVKGKRILLISSGTPIALLIAAAFAPLQKPTTALRILQYIQNTSLSVFHQHGSRWEPVRINCTPHIDPADSFLNTVI